MENAYTRKRWYRRCGRLLLALAASLFLTAAYAAVVYRYDFSQTMLESDLWETVAKAPQLEFARVGAYLQLKGRLQGREGHHYFFASKKPLKPSQRYKATVQISFAAIPKDLPVPLDSSTAPPPPAVSHIRAESPQLPAGTPLAHPPVVLFGLVDKAKGFTGAWFLIYPREVQTFSNAQASGSEKEQPLRKKVAQLPEGAWRTYGLTYDAPKASVTFTLNGESVGQAKTSGLSNPSLFFGLSSGEGDLTKEVTFARWKELRLEEN